jgi:hypothetical protein
MLPLSLRERGLGVRATPPVSRTLKSPRCCDRAGGTIRRAMQYPHPSPLPEGEGGLPDLFRRNCSRLTPMGAGGGCDPPVVAAAHGFPFQSLSAAFAPLAARSKRGENRRSPPRLAGASVCPFTGESSGRECGRDRETRDSSSRPAERHRCIASGRHGSSPDHKWRRRTDGGLPEIGGRHRWLQEHHESRCTRVKWQGRRLQGQTETDTPVQTPSPCAW